MALQRSHWSSRAAFIVASIGAAIGFGNVWRFPTLAYSFGGGAFFVPYLLALFIIGIPLLILEVAVGQYYQTGDAGAFGKVHRRFRGVGLGSILAAFVVTTYYCVLLAWVLRMFVYSCQGSEGRWKDRGEEAFGWFAATVTGLESVGDDQPPTRLVGPNVGALAIVWVFIFLCLAFGVKWTGRIAYVTVGLPIIFLIILLIRALTLDGSGDGVRAYIGEWDMSVLSDAPQAWSQAVTQVFFSLSVTFGIMTAYASYNDRNSPVFSNSIIIAIANSVYSIVAGFAVFGTVGYIAKLENKPVKELTNLGGPALIFGTYPVALSTLPGAGHWERLFFIALFLLGIDSAFALAEGVATVFHDSALLCNVPRAVTTAGVCTVGFLGGLLFCTDTGLLWLATTDHYINFIMLLVGFWETFAVGWIYGIEHQIARLGWKPVVGFMGGTFVPVCIASAFWFGAESREIMKGFVSLVVSYVVLMSGVGYLCVRVKREEKELTWKELLTELLMGNVLKLRKDLIGVVRYIPLLWFFMVRNLLPQLLLILFANLSTGENASGSVKEKRQFGNFEGYPRPYQAVGIFVFVLTCIVILVGAVFPEGYACFDTSTVVGQEEKEGQVDEESGKMETGARMHLSPLLFD